MNLQVCCWLALSIVEMKKLKGEEMKRQKQIHINQYQLNALLNQVQKEGYKYLLKKGVYCTTCGGAATNVTVEEIHLNALNDTMIHGICEKCKGKVTRIMEFGEDKEFFEKANNFRTSINN